MATFSATFVLKKTLITSLKDLSLAVNNHFGHGLFSFLSFLPILVLRNLELEANKLYNRANKLYKAAFLTRCYAQHFLSAYIDSESTITDILSKYHSLTKVWRILIYIVSLKII